MSNNYWCEAKEIKVVISEESHPKSVGIKFSYINDNLAPADEIISNINLEQMKFLKEVLSKYIYEIEHGVPEDEKHLLN
ncbi:hypothetical protein CCF81_18170 [Salmonella enterica]|nr:hypothetical protein [Salmonella enterica subsp. enterica serovar Kisarawe]ECU8777691.1 hypothetical protein [Salmonella enterica]